MPDDTGKPALRERFLARRRARSAGDIEQARAAVRALVLARCTRSGWTSVAGYVPLRTEPGSTELLDELASLGVRVIVPVLLPDRDLDWTAWPDQGERLGPDAIADVDAVLVPALAVASGGTRLGRGGGSYDRALRRVSAAVVAALLFVDELVEDLPADEWDVPVDAAVTPAGWRDVGRAPNLGESGDDRHRWHS